MTTGHLILRWAHISMGITALMSGAAAMTFLKGSPLHKQAGNVFFVAMLIMAATGTYISIFITPIMGNVMGGSMTFYLTATAWLTVKREPNEIGRWEVVLAALGLAVAIAGISLGWYAAQSPTGKLDGYRPVLYYVFGGAALLGTALDVRMIARGGFRGTARLTRHLSRMCFAFFIATGSFFFGQAKLFPAAVRESGLLSIPALLPFALLLYWVVRIKVLPRIRTAWTPSIVRQDSARSSAPRSKLSRGDWRANLERAK